MSRIGWVFHGESMIRWPWFGQSVADASAVPVSVTTAAALTGAASRFHSSATPQGPVHLARQYGIPVVSTRRARVQGHVSSTCSTTSLPEQRRRAPCECG